MCMCCVWVYFNLKNIFLYSSTVAIECVIKSKDKLQCVTADHLRHSVCFILHSPQVSVCPWWVNLGGVLANRRRVSHCAAQIYLPGNSDDGAEVCNLWMPAVVKLKSVNCWFHKKKRSLRSLQCNGINLIVSVFINVES